MALPRNKNSEEGYKRVALFFYFRLCLVKTPMVFFPYQWNVLTFHNSALKTCHRHLFYASAGSYQRYEIISFYDNLRGLPLGSPLLLCVGISVPDNCSISFFLIWISSLLIIFCIISIEKSFHFLTFFFGFLKFIIIIIIVDRNFFICRY